MDLIFLELQNKINALNRELESKDKQTDKLIMELAQQKMENQSLSKEFEIKNHTLAEMEKSQKLLLDMSTEQSMDINR